MPYSKRRVATLLLLGISRTVAAQQEDSKESGKAKLKADDEVVAKVIVKANTSDYDPRRDDTASKTVINQEELLKYGDTNILNVLKRAPGITVVDNSIRMRGLGNGYTQILVNGERPSPGVSIENIPPVQIERIEIIRAAVAEFSMQAIAGTINIVLKKVVAQAQRDLRLSSAITSENKSNAATLTLADRSGNLSYFLTTTATKTYTTPWTSSADELVNPEGDLVQLRESRSSQNSHTEQLIVQPRVNWKLSSGDQLNFGGFVQAINSVGSVSATTKDLIGAFATPDYVNRNSATTGNIRYAGADASWASNLAGGKLNIKMSLNQGWVTNKGGALYRSDDFLTTFQRNTYTDNTYQTLTNSGKFSRSISEGNNLAVGWESSNRTIDQHSVRHDRLTGMNDVMVDEIFQRDVKRIAAYAQDEWSVSKLWSVYLGARWERIVTDSTGTSLDASRSQSQVLSPVAQSLYKFPDGSGRQVRVALTRTYKAPDISQLNGHRFVAALNTRFTPDSGGNPDLKPELATGIDLTYEHFWAPAALFSISVSERQISDYIRSTLRLDQNQLWLNQPFNSKRASTDIRR